MMSQVDFENYCKDHVVTWYNFFAADDSKERTEGTVAKQATVDDVFMVWFCKTADKIKGIFGLSIPEDNHFFEFTYISKDLIVMDVYDKVGKSNLVPSMK